MIFNPASAAPHDDSAPTQAAIWPPFYLSLPPDAEGESLEMVGLLYWEGAAPTRRYSLLAPLYFDATDEAQHSRLTVIPLGLTAIYRDPTRSFTWAGPYVANEQAGEYWRTLAPLYAGWGDSRESTDILLPIGWRHNVGSESEWFAPALLSGGWRGRSGELTILAGLYGQRRWAGAEASWLAPLYYHEKGARSSFTLFPVGFHEEKPSGVRGLYGIYYRERSSACEADVLFPIFWRSASTREEDRWGFPFYFYHRAGREGHQVFFPIYWNVFDSADEFSLFIPLYGHYRDNRSETDLWVTPLGYASASKEESSGWLGLYGWRQSAQGGYNILAPLFFRLDESEGFTETVLGIYWRDKDPEGELTVVAPLYWDIEKPDSRLTIIFPYYQYEMQGGVTQQGVPPFYQQVDSPTYAEWEILGGLIGRRSWRDGREEWKGFYVGYDRP